MNLKLIQLATKAGFGNEDGFPLEEANKLTILYNLILKEALNSVNLEADPEDDWEEGYQSALSHTKYLIKRALNV